MLLYSLFPTDVTNHSTNLLSLSLGAKVAARDCSTVELSWNYSNHSLWEITIEEYILEYWVTDSRGESKNVTLLSNVTSYSLPARLLQPGTNYTISLNATARFTVEDGSHEVAIGASVVTVLTPLCPGEVTDSPPVACQGCMGTITRCSSLLN